MKVEVTIKGRSAVVLALIAAVSLICADQSDADEIRLLAEDFSDGLAHWWIEGGEEIWVAGESLFMKADSETKQEEQVATAWLRKSLPADVKVSFDAQVIRSRRGVNNINVFLGFSDPTGADLVTTRSQRETAAYELYHQLNGYIFTFVADRKGAKREGPDELRRARIRIRRCPGFELLAETYTYHNVAGRIYEIEIRKRGPELIFSVDGIDLLHARDENPLQGGFLGLRTFGTYLRWSNIKVVSWD